MRINNTCVCNTSDSADALTHVYLGCTIGKRRRRKEREEKEEKKKEEKRGGGNGRRERGEKRKERSRKERGAPWAARWGVG